MNHYRDDNAAEKKLDEFLNSFLQAYKEFIENQRTEDQEQPNIDSIFGDCTETLLTLISTASRFVK